MNVSRGLVYFWQLWSIMWVIGLGYHFSCQGPEASGKLPDLFEIGGSFVVMGMVPPLVVLLAGLLLASICQKARTGYPSAARASDDG
jgi:hypothetical protein